MLQLLLIEENDRLRPAMKAGLENTGEVAVVGDVASGEQALAFCIEHPPEALLMDVHLAGAMNGIEAVIAIRREISRLPAVFYSSSGM